MDALEFFYDDSIEDFVPILKLNCVTVHVHTEAVTINPEWTREAVEDLTAEIDRDIVRHLMELGINAITDEI